MVPCGVDKSGMCDVSVTLKSAVDHVGECFCLSASSAGITSSSTESTVSLGQYNITVQRSVVLCVTFTVLLSAKEIIMLW